MSALGGAVGEKKSSNLVEKLLIFPKKARLAALARQFRSSLFFVFLSHSLRPLPRTKCKKSLIHTFQHTLHLEFLPRASARPRPELHMRDMASIGLIIGVGIQLVTFYCRRCYCDLTFLL